MAAFSLRSPRYLLAVGAAALALCALPAGASAATITSGPEDGQATNSTSITFEYFDAAAETISCSLDFSAVSCTMNTATLTDVPEGEHTFRVFGSVMQLFCTPMPPGPDLCVPIPTPTGTDQRTFTVDRTDPVISFTSGPSEGSSTGRNVAFGFSANEGTVACRLDGAAVACEASSVALANLAPGTHELVVESTDAAGNIGKATRVFTVVDNKPAITSAPKSVKQGRTISLGVSCPETCTVKGVLKIGKKKSNLKSITATGGLATLSFKFTRKQKKSIKAALKKRKKVSVTFSLGGAESKTVKIKK